MKNAGNALTPFSQLSSDIGHLFVKAGATNHMHKGSVKNCVVVFCAGEGMHNQEQQCWILKNTNYTQGV